MNVSKSPFIERRSNLLKPTLSRMQMLCFDCETVKQKNSHEFNEFALVCRVKSCF